MNKIILRDIAIFMLFIIIAFSHTLLYEVVTWDEFTYILAGKSLVDGFLPYEKVWEMKPPMVYVMYSIPLYLFPDSLIAVRILGFFIVFITSFEIYLILRLLKVKKLLLLSILFYISLMTYYFWLYPTTELLSLPFLLIFVYFAIKSERKRDFILAGLFISLTVLTRTNIAVVAFLFPFFYLTKFYKKYNLKKIIKNISLYALGGLLPLLIFIIIYFSNNKIDLFLVSNINVLFVYSSEISLIDSILNYFITFFKMIYFYPFLFLPLFLIILAIILFKDSKNGKNYGSSFIIFTLITILISIIASKQGFSHHFIQILPIFIIYILISFRSIDNKRILKFIKILIFIPFLYVALSSMFHSIKLVSNIKDIKSEHKIYQYSKKLKNMIRPQDRILALDYHILYWYLHDQTEPLSPFAHSPALVRNSSKYRILPLEKINYVEKNHIDNILNSSPEVIICSTRICEEGRKNLNNDKIKELLSNYTEIERISDTTLWEFTQKSSMIVYVKNNYYEK